MAKTLKEEGTIAFWLQHDHDDWSFCLTCEGTWEEICAGKSRARVEVATVESPGAGSP